MNEYITTPAVDILALHANNTEVIRIDPEGRIFWRGREVETDEEFRSAMLDLSRVFRGVMCAGP